MEHYFLKNGIEIVLYPIKEVRSVTFFLGLNAGTSLEAKEDAGTIHFLEHMVLRGSKKFPTPKDITIAHEELGISSNAWVSNLDCRFWFLIPDTNLEKSFDFIMDTILNPLLTEESVQNSKDVILTEQRNYWDVPENNFYQIIRNSILGKEHINNRICFGYSEVVARMTRDKVVRCYKKYYTPDNFKISIAGNFEVGQAKKIIERTFGLLVQKGTSIKYPKTEELETKKNFEIFNEPRKQVNFNITFPLKGYKEYDIKKRLAMRIFDYMLGSGFSSLLYQRLREDLGYVYNVSSGIYQWPFAGHFQVYGKVNLDRLKPAIVETFKILKRVKEKGFGKYQMQRVKNYFNIKSLVNFSGTDHISEYFLDELLYEEKIRTPEDYIRERGKIKLEEVNKLGEEFLDLKRVNFHLMGDKKLIEKSGVKEIFDKV